MGAHARLSGSSADRFLACPGSVELSRLIPEGAEEDYQTEGTGAHQLGERCLRSGNDCWMHVGDAMENGVVVTPEMADFVQVYVDYVRSMHHESLSDLFIEHRIEDESLGESFGGTADALINGLTVGGGFIHVIDLKYGFTPVDAYDNAQLKYYAFGELRRRGIVRGSGVKVGMTIVQPRIERDGGPSTQWVEADDILEWGEKVLIPGMAAVDTPDAPLVSGGHCGFCPAKLLCPKLTAAFDAVVEDAKSTPDVAHLSDEALALRYAEVEAAETYMRALRKEAYTRAMNGKPLPGTKLVHGRSNRKWKDGAEAAILAVLGDDALTDPELRSPAQIEKLPSGKALVGEWSFKEVGSPKLVSSDDPGDPIDMSAAGEFESVLANLSAQ